MNGRLTEEVTRYELESYVAVGVEGPSMTARQTGAVKKMASLPEENFDELISDVINEIHRRDNMPHSVPTTPTQKKLCKIHEEGFRNLILDILLVMDQRSPGRRGQSGDVGDLIGNLDRLILSLKEDVVSEERAISQIYSERCIVKKMMLFARYVRHVFEKNGEEVRLAEHVMGHLERYKDDEVSGSFGPTFDLDMLLSRCDTSEHKDLPEYKYHRDNIRRLRETEMDASVRERLVKHEASQICAVVALGNTNLVELPRSLLEVKVNSLVEVLHRVKEDISGKDPVDVAGYLGDIVGSVKDISRHIEKDESIGKIYVDQLRSEIDLLESVDGRDRNSGDVFIIILSAVDLIRKILAEVSKSHKHAQK